MDINNIVTGYKVTGYKYKSYCYRLQSNWLQVLVILLQVTKWFDTSTNHIVTRYQVTRYKF